MTHRDCTKTVQGIEILIRVWGRRPSGQTIGIKEDLAMYCERFGDSEVLSVMEVPEEHYEQPGLFDVRGRPRSR